MRSNITCRCIGWLSMAVLASTLTLLAPEAFAQEGSVMTTPEENKEIIRLVTTEGVNTGNLEVFREMLAPDYARHSPATTGMEEIRGVDAMLNFLEAHFTAFPDWHEEMDSLADTSSS
jgi:hypothetical protein